jgi:hypothetical protein
MESHLKKFDAELERQAGFAQRFKAEETQVADMRK